MSLLKLSQVKREVIVKGNAHETGSMVCFVIALCYTRDALWGEERARTSRIGNPRMPAKLDQDNS